MPPTRTAGVFFGWWVVLGFAVMAFLSTGIRFAIGPFLKPMVDELGLDRGSFSLVVAVSLFLYGAFMPVAGTLADRFGVRPVALAGSVLLGLALVVTGFVTQLWQLYVVYGVLASIGLAATGPVVASAIVARWFVARRGTALSVLGSASMTGMSLLVPVAMWLVLALGWRGAYWVFGAGVLGLLVPIALWLARDSPEAMGLAADGATGRGAAAAGEAPARDRTALAVAVQTTSFWLLAGGLFACGFSMSLLSTHGVPMLTDHGYHPMLASWTLGVLGGSSIGLTMVLGAVSDRFGRRPVLAWVYATRAALFAGLFLVRDQPVALLLIAAVGGASMAGSVAMTSALTAEVFGRFSVGTVFGTMFLVHQAGAASGSWLAGALFELTSGYGAAFGAAAALLLGAAVVSLAIREPARERSRLAPIAGGR